MSKTLLIIVGIACAVITAVGIMWYIASEKHLTVSTYIMPTSKEEDISLSSTPNTFDPKSELPGSSIFIKDFIIPDTGEMNMKQYLYTMNENEPRSIEKLALNYINKIIRPSDKMKSGGVWAEIQFSFNRNFAKYSLHIYEEGASKHGWKEFGYNIIFKKISNNWTIINADGRFTLSGDSPEYGQEEQE